MFIKCCGQLGICFHLSCLQFSDTEHSHNTGNERLPCTGVSPVLSCYVCSVNDGTLAKTRSASTSDVPKNVVSPGRPLLPPVFESIVS